MLKIFSIFFKSKNKIKELEEKNKRLRYELTNAQNSIFKLRKKTKELTQVLKRKNYLLSQRKDVFEFNSSTVRPIKKCGKKSYPSKGSVKKAHKRANFAVRAYYCDRCYSWHATNRDK